MAQDRSSRSGFFSLCLNASQKPRTKHLDFRIAVTDKLLKDFTAYVMARNATENLKGLFLFYSGIRLRDAITCFKQVLERDRYNKNAVAHLCMVYQRLHMNSLAEPYKEMQDKFAVNKEKMQKDDKVCFCLGDMETDKERFLFEFFDAEALAEQGFAYQFDCYAEEDEWLRANKSLRLYRRSLDLIQEIKKRKMDEECSKKVQQLELEVKYWWVQCYQKIYQTRHRRNEGEGQSDEAWSPYETGILYLVDIIKSEEAHRELKASAWTVLGVYFYKKPRGRNKERDNESALRIAIKTGIHEEYKDPEKCFMKALELECKERESTEIRIRYASYLSEISDQSARRKNIEKAITKLEDAWKIHPGKGNWFAKTMLAQRNMMMYRELKNRERNKNSSPSTSLCQDTTSPDEFLNNAIKHWEEALEMTTTAQDLANVAEAYYFRGVKRDGTMDRMSDDAMQAADYFWQAVQSLGSERKPEIHKKQGVFLKSIGEERQAIECFKRGMELSTADKPADNFKKLFETFLDMYGQPKEEDDIPNVNSVDELRSSKHERDMADNDNTCKVGSTSGKDVITSESPKPKGSNESNTELTSAPQETLQEEVSSSSVSEKNDIEVDNPDSPPISVPENISRSFQPEQGTLSKDIKTKWKFKKNDILHEMAFWYSYANRKFSAGNLRDVTKTFVEKYPIEMSMMQAYFDQQKDDSHEENKYMTLKSMIENAALEDTATDQTGCGPDNWPEYVKYSKQLLVEREKEKKLLESEENVKETHCRHCSQPLIDQKLLRQNSAVPQEIPRPRTKYYEYDFYVIFSESEQEWVYYCLLQKLESSFYFKGAIPDRDYRPGHSFYSEMERCISNSSKILIVLSSTVPNSSIEHKRGYEIDFALQLSHEKSREHFIIPILKDRNCYPPRQLGTLVCVNAVESNAWERLVTALEHI